LAGCKPWLNLNFLRLQESVNSSEDFSAKTKSVIEVKKLQLLPLQRRVRRFVVVGDPNQSYSFLYMSICLFNYAIPVLFS
jgi:hypothetical protein